MGDRIQVPLELSHFDVVETELADGQLEVSVASTFPRACFHCGSTDVIGHGRNRRRIRDRSHGYPTVLVWDQRRYRCRDCGRTSRERHPETLGSKRVTARFRSSLADAACSQPWSDVALRERVSWWRVADAFEARASVFDPFTGSAPRVVSLDEASFRSRFVFHTVLSAPEQHRILELVEGRSRQSACQALLRMPAPWRGSVETAVIDMCWPYRKAVEDVLPHARIVADKFHVMRTVDTAAQKVRIRHGRRIRVVGSDGGLARQNNPRFNPKMWRSRWLFMRRVNGLNPSERAGLEQLFELHPEVGLAYWLKEAFAHIYQATSREEGETRLDLWVHHVHQAGIPELISTWINMQWWREPILNYFEDPQTNAYAEGITNKIKVLKRRGYGHRDPHRYRAKVLAITPNQPTDPPPIA
jgi:transposase